jgi:oxygen-independent coproporphyrinogen-3 oxidase
VEAANFAALAQAGINRVSLGRQALDDPPALLGRCMTPAKGWPRLPWRNGISAASAST